MKPYLSPSSSRVPRSSRSRIMRSTLNHLRFKTINSDSTASTHLPVTKAVGSRSPIEAPGPESVDGNLRFNDHNMENKPNHQVLRTKCMLGVSTRKAWAQVKGFSTPNSVE